MLTVEQITPFPEEQERIAAVSAQAAPHYDPLMPYSHFGHAHDEVLREVIRLDALSTGSAAPSRRRLQGIAFSLYHDSEKHRPLVSGEGFRNKEERSGQIAAEELPDLGYDAQDIRVIRRLIDITAPGSACETDQEREARRADLSNVSSPSRTFFLSKTAAIFYEKVLLSLRAEEELPVWKTYIEKQQRVLEALFSDDLSLPSERVIRGQGPFNRAGMKNVRWLSKLVVTDPQRFVGTYGRQFLKAPALIPNFRQIVPYITSRADV